MTLLPYPIDHISGLNQKRHWHHITNADHAQVVITYKDGKQAVFINSDLAAARKAKFHLLGTMGSLTGEWDKAAGDRPADLPAIITLTKSTGETQILPPVKAAPNAFHQSVANYLLSNIAMPITTAQSRDVVAIMQAAEESAVLNARPVTANLLTQ